MTRSWVPLASCLLFACSTSVTGGGSGGTGNTGAAASSSAGTSAGHGTGGGVSATTGTGATGASLSTGGSSAGVGDAGTASGGSSGAASGGSGGGGKCPSGGWTFPQDSGVIDVTQPPYRADPSGAADSTAAIQQAIADQISLSGAKNADGYFDPDAILYFPAGTYRVSDRLEWRKAVDAGNGCDGGLAWGAYLSFWGECETGTVLKLVDDAPGYGDPDAGRAVIYTASISGGVCNAGGADWSGAGEGNAAFRNDLTNLTVDVGTGNPGAIAIDYLGNNQARIDHVTVRGHAGSPGLTGISLARRWVGPQLLTNVTVDQFATGIAVGGTEYAASATLAEVTMTNVGQGLVNDDDLTFGRHLWVTTANAAVPAVSNAGDGFLALVDSAFGGPAGTGNAIASDGAATAAAYLRGVSVDGGYATVVPGLATLAGEWTSAPPLNLGGSGRASLGLVVQDPPLVPDTALADWVSVADHGAPPNTGVGASAGIAATLAFAAANGKTVVYFPHGQYFLDSTVTVSSAAQLLGLGAVLSPAKGFTGPAFAVTASAGTVSFERLTFLANFFPGGTAWSVPVIADAHAPPASLVLEDVYGASTAPSGGGQLGDLYLDDVSFGPFTFGGGQRVWARQLDPEVSQTHVTNDGATLWILGLKSEERPTDAGFCASVLDTEDGGQTELIGGAVENWPAKPGAHIGACTNPAPVIVASGSSQSLVYATSANAANATLPVQIQQALAGGVTERLYSYGRAPDGGAAAYLRKNAAASSVPLFVGN
ncbi:MAG: glycosyl hydrolase family 28-related protein [Myxococcales bacterium]